MNDRILLHEAEEQKEVDTHFAALRIALKRTHMEGKAVASNGVKLSPSLYRMLSHGPGQATESPREKQLSLYRERHCFCACATLQHSFRE